MWFQKDVSIFSGDNKKHLRISRQQELIYVYSTFVPLFFNGSCIKVWNIDFSEVISKRIFEIYQQFYHLS